MKAALSNPGIRHKFVKGLESRPGVRIYRKSGTWKDFHADSALVEYGDHRYIIVGLAEHPHGGDWLVRLAAPLHDLVASPAQLAAGAGFTSTPAARRSAAAAASRAPDVRRPSSCAEYG